MIELPLFISKLAFSRPLNIKPPNMTRDIPLITDIALIMLSFIMAAIREDPPIRASLFPCNFSGEISG
jgi:hypothetical protein